jgi:hypothetical protein
VRRFAENARGQSPRALLSIGDCSVACGARRLRVLASHQFASA